MSDSSQLHGLQHTRLLCPSPSPGVCSNSCPLSQWCHPAISSSVTHFSSFPQSSPASGSYLMSQLFSSDGQSIGVSASASFFPMNIQGWFFFRIDWFGLCWSPTDSQESSPALQLESINSLALSLLYGLTFTSVHDHWKNHSFDYMQLRWQSDVSAL